MTLKELKEKAKSIDLSIDRATKSLLIDLLRQDMPIKPSKLKKTAKDLAATYMYPQIHHHYKATINSVDLFDHSYYQLQKG